MILNGELKCGGCTCPYPPRGSGIGVTSAGTCLVPTTQDAKKARPALGIRVPELEQGEGWGMAVAGTVRYTLVVLINSWGNPGPGQ